MHARDAFVLHADASPIVPRSSPHVHLNGDGTWRSNSRLQ
jgi:hypothetical protein